MELLYRNRDPLIEKDASRSPQRLSRIIQMGGGDNKRKLKFYLMKQAEYGQIYLIKPFRNFWEKDSRRSFLTVRQQNENKMFFDL